jgi:hypothetical protein
MPTQFELDYGHDPKLAKRIVNDIFKAPEQRKEAQEFLDSLPHETTQKTLALVLEYTDTITPDDIVKMLRTIPEKEVNWAVDFSINRLEELSSERR